MPDKFIVPQFIDNEDKILGPVTVRQFILSLVAGFFIFIEYRLLKTGPFVLAAVVTAALGGTFGFVKVNGQPFHIFFLNFMRTMSRPKLRIWDKTPTDSDLRLIIKPQIVVDPEDKKTYHKPRPGSSRLRDLTLTVNTGGVYQSENEES